MAAKATGSEASVSFLEAECRKQTKFEIGREAGNEAESRGQESEVGTSGLTCQKSWKAEMNGGQKSTNINWHKFARTGKQI